MLGCCARIVLVVQDAEFRVPALAVQVKTAVFLLVEVDAPMDKLLDLGGGVAHHFLHGGAVADPVARYHGVLDVLLEVVHGQVGHRGDASLCEVCIGLLHACLADEGHRTFMRHFQRETHPGYARADDEEIELSYHKYQNLPAKLEIIMVPSPHFQYFYDVAALLFCNFAA